MKGQALLDEALALASVGLRPVAMLACYKRPARSGWREAASLDPGTITAAFKAARYADALGIATGAGVFVVDIDRNHKNGADGIASFAELIARHGAAETLAVGPRVRTPAGGVHLYFASPPRCQIGTMTELVPGIDVRGDGGLAMVPPSARGGVAYRWEPDPWSKMLSAAPAWLLDLVTSKRQALSQPVPARPFKGDIHPYARAALRHECDAVANCASGSRNSTLFKAAASLGALAAGGTLPAQLVAELLCQSAQACGLIADDGRQAVEATIASGLEHGLQKPRAVPGTSS